MIKLVIIRLSPALAMGGWLLMVSAWLIPNHYPPWAAFHSDVQSALGLCMLVFSVLLSAGFLVWPRLAIATLLVGVIPTLQWTSGLIYFSGDAWMAVLYLGGFALAQMAGASLIGIQSSARTRLTGLFLGLICAALLSLGVACYQWLGLSGLDIFAADFPPGSRPFANLGQPNQLATLLLLGLISAFSLNQFRVLNGAALTLLAIFLCFGIAMTQSRTSWLVMAGLVSWVSLMKDRAQLCLTRRGALATGCLLLAMVVLWDPLSQWLMLTPGRTVTEQIHGGTRFIHWASMFDAIERQPWVGYGWNQVSVAQSRVILDHPHTGEFIEHSHNLFLDLLVWNGIPLGLTLTGVLTWWFVRHVRACQDGATAWLLTGIGAVFVHAMLEYPLDYAYFLLPVGLMMGVVDALSPVSCPVHIDRRWIGGLVGTAALIFGWVVVEYRVVEDSYRQLRFQSARIGGPATTVKIPDLVLLTQLDGLLRFTATQARRDMTPEQVAWMGRVSERYGLPQIQLRYALAAGLNGEEKLAGNALARLCKTQAEARCNEARTSWRQLQHQYPELASIVVPPSSLQR